MQTLNRSEMARMRRENATQTKVLIIGLALILGFVGWVWFAQLGLILALLGVAFIWFASPKMSGVVLKMYKAQEVNRNQAPVLVDVVEELAQRAELEFLPTLYWIPSKVPNAFATGQDENMAIAISDGLLKMMGRREIVAVLAHEASHLRNGDVKVMMFADAISRIVGSFAQFGFLLVLFGGLTFFTGGVGVPILGILTLLVAPTLTTLLQLALSRSREYNADLGAVELTNDPQGMISALSILERQTGGRGWERIFRTQKYEAVPAALRTHPQTKDRIARLEQMKTNAVEPQAFLASSERPDFEEVVEVPFGLVKKPRYHFFNGLRY